MNDNKYRYIIYIISVATVTVLAIQGYWHYANFELNRQKTEVQIQESFQEAAKQFFEIMEDKNLMALVTKDSIGDIRTFPLENVLGGLLKKGMGPNMHDQKDSVPYSLYSLDLGIKKNLDNVTVPSVYDDSIFKKIYGDVSRVLGDSIKLSGKIANQESEVLGSSLYKRDTLDDFTIVRGRNAVDSVRKIYGNKVFVLNTSFDVDFSQIDSLFFLNLKENRIQADYQIEFQGRDTLYFGNLDKRAESFPMEFELNSPKLIAGNKLFLYYSLPLEATLKKSIGGILLSLFLSLVIVYSLWFLIKIIRQQKQLDEMKNDLINNITHEFKTPIATASAAIEGVMNFTGDDDKGKKTRYLNVSRQQLKKLDILVEKLLETALMDSGNLMVNRVPMDLVHMVRDLVKRYEFKSPGKQFTVESSVDKFEIPLDRFHFENALSNLLDNAVKYGGNSIIIKIQKEKDGSGISLSVIDNGNGISKPYLDKVFEKFYRVPTKNHHQVKGHGIGLYYTKNIVEKHEGVISVESDNQGTIFKIKL